MYSQSHRKIANKSFPVYLSQKQMGITETVLREQETFNSVLKCS